MLHLRDDDMDWRQYLVGEFIVSWTSRPIDAPTGEHVAYTIDGAEMN